MMNPRAQVLAVSLMMCSVAHAQMQPRPAVVELFTSQGCNSCPPAEAYIGELAQRKDVLALSFHVDYWDDLGWKDPFSLGVSTARQSAYSTARGRASVYTPQVVIDGEGDFVGTDRPRIGRSLAAPRSGVPVGISLQEGDVVVDLGARAGIVPSEVLMILYLRKATTPVGRGENAGRKLEEFNIVRGVRYLGQWKGDAVRYRTHQSSLPRDATDVAILVQSTSEHHVIGVDTRALNSEQSAH